MPLTLIVTNIGRAALVNAQNTGTDPVTIAQIGISASALVPSPTATTLPNELKRISTLSGDVVDDDTIHLVVRDETADAYIIKSWALYLADGTLFAIYGQAGAIIDKTASSIMLLAIDVRFADITAASLTFGSTNFLNPPATEQVQGVVQLATPAQALAGTDPVLVPPVKAIHDAVFAWLDARFGVNNALVWNPNNDGAGSGLDAGLFAGQLPAYYTNIPARLGYTPLNTANYTAADILAKFLTVDGAGSGTDADLLDGQHGNYYLPAVSYTAADVKAKLITVDGAGSGVDADLLDGQDGSYYGNIAARLGFTPVRQGGGVGQLTNTILIGWSAAGRLKATVDVTDQGNFVFDSNISDVWRSSNDGAGSGLDAGLFAGQLPAYYVDIPARLGYNPLNAASYTAADVKAKLLTVDGAGSGVDADLLDGQDGAYYGNIPARLGYTPVNRAGDTYLGMLTFGAGSGFDLASFDVWASIRVMRNIKAGSDGMWIGYGNANAGRTRLFGDGSTGGHVFPDANGNFYRSDGSLYWHSGIDGAGSGLDADLLDGQDWTFYTNIPARLGYTPLNAASYTAADVIAKVLTVDGAGSGIDADMLDGRHASDFALATQFQSGNNANGYWRKVPDGNGGFILEQWGKVIGNYPAGVYNFAFPIQFPTACEDCQLTIVISNANQNYDTWVQLISADQNGAAFIINIDSGFNSNWSMGVSWRAIGR